jgi:hypothetical protein
MKTAPTAAAKLAALDLRKSLLAPFAAKEHCSHPVLSSIDLTPRKVPPGGKGRAIAALSAAPIYHVRLAGQISMVARPPKMGFGSWERGTLRPESVAGK